ncbi:unnamed protein product [Schistocephalus solidus]|uniref:C2H2-type domain-containing protein n=1 Tax=Schistocephalus solidus TaxID=70667 RepID=A0A183TLU4_SCHSO|nr:unnamed protein product [Schistocephalus solidus]
MMLQGHFEEIAEATANQPGDLGGPCPVYTGSTIYEANLIAMPRPKVGTKFTSAPDKHRRCPGPANRPALSTHLPRANQPGWTSSDAMHQQSDHPNFYVKFCQPSFRLPHPHSWHQFHFFHHHRDQNLYSSPVTPTTTAFTFTHTTTTTISDGDSLLNCPQCDRTFTSRIGLVGHLRIHRTETGEPVPGAPTHRRDRCLHCPHCPRAFTHRMGLFGHMRIHDSGIHHNANNNDTPCTTSAPAILTETATPTSLNDIPQPLPISPAHTAPTTSTHASAWSVTCESIARRLVNQCLGLRPTFNAPASTAFTTPAHLHTTWAY